MYVSSYVDDAGELKSCKQSSIRKASKELRQRNERCGRVALDRSIAKLAFEKFAKNRQTHKFFGFGVNAMGGRAATAQLTPQDLAKRSSLGGTARAAKKSEQLQLIRRLLLPTRRLCMEQTRI